MVDHGREVMTHEEMKKIQNEIKLKLMETVTDRGLDYIAKSILLKKILKINMIITYVLIASQMEH